MFSRRPIVQQNRGRIPAGLVVPSIPPIWTPLSITSVPIVLWARSDLGVGEAGGAGTGISVWADQSPNLRDFTQATIALRMVLDATGGPGGRPCIKSGGTKWLVANWLNPAPATTPTFIWAMVRQDTFVTSSNVWGESAAARLALRNNTTSPNVLGSNGTNTANTSFPADGTWRRVQEYFSATSADYLKVGSNAPVQVAASGNMGNNTGSGNGFHLAATNGGVNLSDASFCEVLITEGIPTELADLETYGVTLYPGALF